jgi:hypothetical protein
VPLWRRAVVVVAATAAVGVGAAGAARDAGYRDEFTTFDARLWVTSSQPFGRGVIDPANVGAANGTLAIRLPAGRLDGGEIRSNSLTTSRSTTTRAAG